MKDIARRTLQAWERERQAKARLDQNTNEANFREWRRLHQEARTLERDWWSRSDRVL